MSPVTLSAPSTQTFHPTPQRKGVRFGRDAEPDATQEAQTDKAEFSKTTEAPAAEGVNDGETNESKAPEVPKAAEKPNFFKQLGERLGKFFSRIAKAFQKLFAPAKPQTAIDRNLKQFQNLMKQSIKQVRKNLQPEVLQACLKERAEKIQENGSPQQKKDEADLLEAAKTDEGLKKFVQDNHENIAAAYFLAPFQEHMEELEKCFTPVKQESKAVQTGEETTSTDSKTEPDNK